ncbi:MAG: type I glyceraldehyde-3-phosphate dehydrogenase [Candidatus Portnoybacteria bacterium RBG_13_40_8]|uniref:Type I glyceraldehyde-3-phosphate dehydrogenase n=1 Tax=Candidatus Portnoybacteria bacterium RBG_13_40_8 TaxID=1801990 RepID=A0A1G2F4L7_9BACT|nr:MAG: type I glyceraldehyde-3-phosphate dehydrogenase [Candidatus Portnoybacteria bacterium RBG_13_40_8]
MFIKVAINGFGRIGRTFFRLAHERHELRIVAINDLADLENLAYLLKHDSVYRNYARKVGTDVKNKKLIVDNDRIEFLQEKDPSKLPWAKLGVDVVVESTGFFETFESSSAHLKAGAKRVVITAPAKDDDESMNLGATVLLGINEKDMVKVKITSNGSCTTNAVAPVMAVLSENPGIKKAVLNTIHAYTATQRIVDGPDAKDWRRGRAGAISLVPSTTGAAVTVTKVVKNLKNLFDGIAIRTPVPTVSLADITFVANRKTSVEEINNILTEAAKKTHWKGILGASKEQLVSSDLVGVTTASIVDLNFTKVIDGDLVKILAWYDNEWGYSATLVEHVIKAGKLISKKP